MFLPKQLEKFTNYNSYIIGHSLGSVHEVDHMRLSSFIGKLHKKFKNPYIRFMWVTQDGVNEAVCVVYSDHKKNERLTKLVPFSEAEKV